MAYAIWHFNSWESNLGINKIHIKHEFFCVAYSVSVKSAATYKKVLHFSRFDVIILVSSGLCLLAASFLGFLLRLKITRFFLDKIKVQKYCKENFIWRKTYHIRSKHFHLIFSNPPKSKTKLEICDISKALCHFLY